MARRSRLRAGGSFNDGTGLNDVDLAAWPSIDELALSAERRALYRRRERAIRLYLNGATDRQIQAACSLGRGPDVPAADRALPQNAPGWPRQRLARPPAIYPRQILRTNCTAQAQRLERRSRGRLAVGVRVACGAWPRRAPA